MRLPLPSRDREDGTESRDSVPSVAVAEAGMAQLPTELLKEAESEPEFQEPVVGLKLEFRGEALR